MGDDFYQFVTKW